MSDRRDAWLREAFADIERELAVEAAYYVVRELKQSSVPAESRKDHFMDAAESEPSPAAQALAGLLVSDIERREGMPIVKLAPQSRFGYIRALLEMVRSITGETLNIDVARGRALLADLRDPERGSGS